MQFLVESPTSHPRSRHDSPTPLTVPFGAVPGSQPGSLSYGFGLSSASNLSAGWGTAATASGSGGGVGNNGGIGAWRATTGWGSSPNRTPQPPPPTTATLASSPSSVGFGSAVGNSRRRKRSVSPEGGEEDDMGGSGSTSTMDDGQQHQSNASNASSPIKVVRGMKKARMGNGVGITVGDTAKEGVDLGKSLASLSKDSLLSLLTNLVTTNPSLIPTITSLLPPPTLSNTLSTLSTLERAVLSSLPSGQLLREEYIWGRVRVPLEEYVTEAKGFLTAFCSPTNGGAGGGGGGEDEIGHPSTTFAFLYALTSSLRRLEVALPPTRPNTTNPQNPLAAHLLPLTLNHWHVFLTRLSVSINQEGKIISAGVLRGWFAKLDELCVDSPGVGVGGGRMEGMAKRALEGVRHRLVRELGWCVGIRESGMTVGSGGSGQEMGMDEEEEL